MIHEQFRTFSHKTVYFLGTAWAFSGAVIGVIIWLIIGIFYHFSANWQLFFTIGTPGVTFLLLFLIQHKQNRDVTAINLKLDELLLANRKAHNNLIDVDAENLPEETLIKQKEKLVKKAKKQTRIIHKREKI